MDFPSLPLAEFLDLRDGPDGSVTMPRAECTLNHVGTAHAGAQFILAETASGKCLREAFPDLYGKTLPVLRRADAKYRGPGMTDLHARASMDEQSRRRFRAEIGERGRSMISIQVRVSDSSGNETLRAEYEWYVQRLP